MKEKVYLIGISLFLTAFWGCQEQDMTESNNGSVTVDLAFSVSHAARETRLTDEVVQKQPTDGQSYRGLGDVYMIPFDIEGNDNYIKSTDRSLRLFDDAGRTDYDPIANPPYTKAKNYGGFYLYNSYTMMRGTNAFLVYGKAPVPENASKAVYGSLQVPVADLIVPDLTTLKFRPDPIYSETTTPIEARLLAGYLTHIAEANTGGTNPVFWSSTTDPTLQLIYKLFTGQENDGTLVLAGASVNVVAHVNALYNLISQLTFSSSEAEIQSAIIECIQDYNYNEGGNTLVLVYNDKEKTDPDWRLKSIRVNGKTNYPALYDLPDGAAALRWNTNTNHFEPQTVTTTLANINNINRFCYPAELFYYANSRIKTSNEDADITVYENEEDWDNVLSSYTANTKVTGDTKAVAIQQPLQYAVGRLEITLTEVTGTTLQDDAGKEIPLTNNTQPSFPLTGIIVCNQHPVGFDFKPVLTEGGAALHADDCFIYDSQVGNSCCLSNQSNPSTPSTLVLQSYDTGDGDNKDQAEKVTIALEFRNESGEDFRGKGGVIYRGTKFYLIGEIDPAVVESEGDDDYTHRVFTQDYVTTVSTKVESLANAYNVLPNLLGDRLELGIKLITDWVQAQTTNVVLP